MGNGWASGLNAFSDSFFPGMIDAQQKEYERKRKEKAKKDEDAARAERKRKLAEILVPDATDEEKQVIAETVDSGGTGTQAAATIRKQRKEKLKEKQSVEAEKNAQDKDFLNQEILKEQRRMAEVDQQRLNAEQRPQYDQATAQNFDTGQAAGMTGKSLSAYSQNPKTPEWQLKLLGGFPQEPEKQPKPKDMTKYYRDSAMAQFEQDLLSPERNAEINQQVMNELKITPNDLIPGSDTLKRFDRKRKQVLAQLRADNKAKVLAQYPPGVEQKALEASGSNLDAEEKALDAQIKQINESINNVSARLQAAGY